MDHPRFNPSQSVKFDLARGAVSVDGAGRLLMPADLLGELWASAGEEQQRDFGRRLGTELGRRVVERLGASRTEHASVEAVVEHLGGDVALAGLGSLSVERWGRALVVVVEGSPLGAAGDGLLAALLEGALQRLMGRDAAVVVLGRDGARVRMVVLNPSSALRVKSWLGSGVAWGEVLSRLHSGEKADA